MPELVTPTDAETLELATRLADAGADEDTDADAAVEALPPPALAVRNAVTELATLAEDDAESVDGADAESAALRVRGPDALEDGEGDVLRELARDALPTAEALGCAELVDVSDVEADSAPDELTSAEALGERVITLAEGVWLPEPDTLALGDAVELLLRRAETLGLGLALEDRDDAGDRVELPERLLCVVTDGEELLSAEGVEVLLARVDAVEVTDTDTVLEGRGDCVEVPVLDAREERLTDEDTDLDMAALTDAALLRVEDSEGKTLVVAAALMLAAELTEADAVLTDEDDATDDAVLVGVGLRETEPEGVEAAELDGVDCCVTESVDTGLFDACADELEKVLADAEPDCVGQIVREPVGMDAIADGVLEGEPLEELVPVDDRLAREETDAEADGDTLLDARADVEGPAESVDVKDGTAEKDAAAEVVAVRVTLVEAVADADGAAERVELVDGVSEEDAAAERVELDDSVSVVVLESRAVTLELRLLDRDAALETLVDDEDVAERVDDSDAAAEVVPVAQALVVPDRDGAELDDAVSDARDDAEGEREAAADALVERLALALAEVRAEALGLGETVGCGLGVSVDVAVTLKLTVAVPVSVAVE